VSASVAAVIYTAVRIFTTRPIRTSANCTCGAVVLEITVGATSQLIKPASIGCACSDCVGFVERVAKAPRSLDKSAARPLPPIVDPWLGCTHMVQCFRSDVRVTSGAAHVRASKLSAGAPMVRFYAACCGTPLALSPEPAVVPILPIYASLIENATLFPPMSSVGGYKSARPGAHRSDVLPSYDTNIPPAFMLRTLARAVLGLVLSKWRPHPFSEAIERGVEVLPE
jgi:hypothetical protein